ncbi:MAG: WD40 repeat domain-containing protein [Pirellulaceae bacterium]
MCFSKAALVCATLLLVTHLQGQDVSLSRQLPLQKQMQLSIFPGDVETIRVAPDGKLICVGWRSDKSVPGGAQLLDAQTLQPRFALDIGLGGSNSDAAFTPDSRFLVTLSFRSVLRIWDPLTGKMLGQGSKPAWDWHVCCHPNNKECVSSGGQAEIRRWEIPSGKLISETDTGFKRIVGMDLSSDGKRLAMVGRRDDATVFLQVRSYPDLKLLHESTTSATSGMHAAVVFSPNGKRLACTTSGDGTLLIVDSGSGKVLNKYAAGFSRSNDMQFINDRQMISHGWRRSPAIIDLDTGVVTTLKGVVEIGGAGMAWTNKSGKRSLLLGHAGDERGQISIWDFPVDAIPASSKPAANAPQKDEMTPVVAPSETS